MIDNDLEDWEKSHVNSLTLKMIFWATAGTLLATAIAYILKKSALGDIQPELLFVPWGIVLVLGISTAFKRGVAAERERYRAVTAAETKPAAKTTTRKKATTKRKKATTKKTAAASTATAATTASATAKKPAAKKATTRKKTAAKTTAAKTTTAKKAAPKKTATKKKTTTKKTTTKK